VENDTVETSEQESDNLRAAGRGARKRGRKRGGAGLRGERGRGGERTTQNGDAN
jgi:hypothetical protein